MTPAPTTRRSFRTLGRAALSTLVAIAVLEALVAGTSWLTAGEFGRLWLVFAILAVPVGFVFGAVGYAAVSGRARP